MLTMSSAVWRSPSSWKDWSASLTSTRPFFFNYLNGLIVWQPSGIQVPHILVVSGPASTMLAPERLITVEACGTTAGLDGRILSHSPNGKVIIQLSLSFV